jgi:GNAT superfamily N-acetyltransferase
VIDVSALVFRELTASPAHRALLHRFYDEAYSPEFPDPDEKESLDNIERYLELKTQGWYGDNAYHVVVVEAGDAIVAGAISDYLADPNAGVVEFLVVTPAARGQGLGRRLLDVTEASIDADAQRVGRPAADFIIAEINDPFRVDLAADNLDPFLRARVWSGWGYRKLDFPYVQPALSEAQQPVRHLLLAVKPVMAAYAKSIPGARLLATVRAYLEWAMRIPDPDANAEYRAMREHLARSDRVASIPLARYVGHDPATSIAVDEVVRDGPDLDAVLAVYKEAFAPDPTFVSPAALRRAVAERETLGPRARYHLWGLREAPAAPVAGMASFYSLPGVGFGGYLALGASLRGRGRLPGIVARIEEQMRRDETGARGWLIECVPNSEALAIFRRLGFREPALDYRQPPLDAAARAAPRLVLAYKEFGAVYGDPALDREELRNAVRAMFATVYGIDARAGHPLLADLEAQMQAWPTPAVEWRSPPT